MGYLFTKKQFVLVIITTLLSAFAFAISKYICEPNIKRNNMYMKELKGALISTFITALIKEIIVNILE